MASKKNKPAKKTTAKPAAKKAPAKKPAPAKAKPAAKAKPTTTSKVEALGRAQAEAPATESPIRIRVWRNGAWHVLTRAPGLTVETATSVAQAMVNTGTPRAQVGRIADDGKGEMTVLWDSGSVTASPSPAAAPRTVPTGASTGVRILALIEAEALTTAKIRDRLSLTPGQADGALRRLAVEGKIKRAYVGGEHVWVVGAAPFGQAAKAKPAARSAAKPVRVSAGYSVPVAAAPRATKAKQSAAKPAAAAATTAQAEDGSTVIVLRLAPGAWKAGAKVTVTRAADGSVLVTAR